MCKKPAKKDFYLLMLEHGMATLESGTTQDDVLQHFKGTHNYNFDSDDKMKQFRRIFWDVFSDLIGKGGAEGNKLYMDYGGIF